jgi:hypothetical protein
MMHWQAAYVFIDKYGQDLYIIGWNYCLFIEKKQKMENNNGK